MDTNTKMIKEDVIVSKVVGESDEKPSALMVFGFTGKSNEEGYLRLYLTPQLDDCVDIPTDTIYNSMEVPPPLSYFGGSLLWIGKESEVLHYDDKNQVFKASFAEGRKKNGKNDRTYADVLKGMYVSNEPEEMQNQSSPGIPGAPPRNNGQPDFFTNLFGQMMANMLSWYAQNAGQMAPQTGAVQQQQPVKQNVMPPLPFGQQGSQVPGTPAGAYSLQSPHILPSGLVEHNGVAMNVMAPPVNNGFQQAFNSFLPNNMMQQFVNNLQSQSQQPMGFGMPQPPAPAAGMQNQAGENPYQVQNSPQSGFPGNEEWPSVPASVKQTGLTVEQRQLLNNGGGIN